MGNLTPVHALDKKHTSRVAKIFFFKGNITKALN